ncbi:MAG: WYL domain-containing protein [Acidimicrobiia bacterium]
MTNSPKTAGRINRLLAMLPWVIANPGAPVEEVCERFGYTRTDLIKDLNTVFVCGLPGYGPGDLMDASIDDDEVVVELAEYFARPLRLTAPEALGILASAKAVQSAGSGGKALDRAIAKLERTLLPDAADAVVVDLPEPSLVGDLRRAATDGEVVRIDHTSIASGERRVREIEPWSVFTTLGNWYVSGHCRSANAERVFRIDRIRTVETTGERFDAKPASRKPAVRYTSSDDDAHATIRLDRSARWVAEYYPVDVLDNDPDGMTIRMSVGDPAVAARLLIRLGASAELVEGTEVAGATADLRGRIVARYAGGARND